MKNLGFNSPYALAGMCFAVISIAVSTFFDFTVHSASSGPVGEYVVENVRGARERPQWTLQKLTLKEKENLRSRANVPNFRDAGDDAFYYGSATPCFVVNINPDVEGHNDRLKTHIFGDLRIETTDLFRSGLEVALAESFTEEVWARDKKCFNGSFVVSFNVDGEGRLADNMLVHHIKGSANEAGIAVLDVLRDMDINGHRWHDGSLAGGEVRVPVSFRLEN
ncbi:hypothetical protein FUA23_09900 [Neolewinella aurantiaca]|uniref:TonB C-terminal domain-containing protein n=1 Tax=Neolewinella aurantiaca TaxID=2602767 RepID=A0A5C7FP97_9BACT|nr:hypothetical protein [Neolewinella aurantiaca]TXF89508.1 hypothetical protein FUA23_09900 [Neolewinella aurantiaca]